MFIPEEVIMQKEIAVEEAGSPEGEPVEFTTALEYGMRELDVTLIRATNYTDDGYPIKAKVGVVRSNTLVQMAVLTRDLVNHSFFKGVSINVRQIDEAVDRVPVKEILRCAKIPGVTSIVMLVGVQTSQFPRAQDIAAWFLPHGIPVLLGGFHVSGTMAMIGFTDDLTAAMAQGIILVAGEVENARLPVVIEDVLRGRSKQLYNFLNPLPDLTNIPTPHLTKDDFQNFSYSTLDTGRGCVFTCDFCTIINVQGRTMRCRDPRHVVEFVRQTYRETGATHCFFTDDNLARNPRWRELFEGLIHLREKELIPFTFMMQSDLAARKLPGGDFFVLAARAGCNHVFLGVESVNRENLRSQGKFQNQTSQYQDFVSHCHSLGIACHAGYILGLPFDTSESVRQDITELQCMGFDGASFYILTPLPGSKDHQRWLQEGRWMHEDFNTYDSAHVAVTPERMTNDELWQTYHSTWEQFYSTEHMVNVLSAWRHDWKQYWARLSFFAAYRYASAVEHLHPMNCGFWTVRRRNDRRPGFPREAFFPFWWFRFKDSTARVRGIIKLFFQLEEVWLQSRPKTNVEQALQDLIAKTKQEIVDWRELKTKELVVLYRKLQDQIPEVKVPSVVTLWIKKHNPFAGSFTRAHVRRTWKRWYLHVWNPVKWIEVWLFEWVNGMRFLMYFLVKGR